MLVDLLASRLAFLCVQSAGAIVMLQSKTAALFRTPVQVPKVRAFWLRRQNTTKNVPPCKGA